jgi:antitoxin YefM
MKKVNYIDFKSNMNAYLDKVTEEKETIILDRDIGKRAVILSEKEYNSIMETLHLLGSKANARRLFESIDQINKGKFNERDLLA